MTTTQKEKEEPKVEVYCCEEHGWEFRSLPCPYCIDFLLKERDEEELASMLMIFNGFDKEKALREFIEMCNCDESQNQDG